MKIIIACLLGMTLNVCADDIGLPWVIECEGSHCLMQIESPYERAGKKEYVGLLVSLDQRSDTIEKVGIIIPNGTDINPHIMVKFVDTVPKDNTFTLVESKGKTLRLAVANCNKKECVVIAQPKVDSMEGMTVDWKSELLEREHLWILFSRASKQERAFIPLYKFRDKMKKIP